MYSTVSEYEVPVVGQNFQHPSYTIREFVDRYDNLPVQANLINCNDLPRELICHMKHMSDIIVHKRCNVSCLLVRGLNKKHFLISPNAHITFADHPRTYEFIFDLISCDIGTQVRVMKDIASDYPCPYSLKYGDVLKITTNKSTKFKMKKKTKLPEHLVLNLEKLCDNGEFEKIVLPLDLEVQLIEMTDLSAQKLYKLSDILSEKHGLADGPVSIVDGDTAKGMALPSVFQMIGVVRDEVALISPVNPRQTDQIDPLVKNCVCLPVRHNVIVSYNNLLHLPKDYFVLPRSKHRKTFSTEQISESTAQYLLDRTAEKSRSYEEIALNHGSPLPQTNLAASLDPIVEKRTKRVNKSLQRISQMFNKQFNRKSRLFDDDLSKGAVKAEENVYTEQEEHYVQPVSVESYDDDENPYEFVDVQHIQHNNQ